MNRYIRNMNTLSEEENKSLKSCKVCVIGCGGLGGYIIEELGRIGVGYITAVDADVFDETNLNRQVLSDTTLIGSSKSKAAYDRMQKVNPEITLNAVHQRLDEENGIEIITGHHVVVDALDNAATKKLLGRLCSKLNIPLVHGAIGGWYGQVSTILPGDDTLNLLYKDDKAAGVEKQLGNPPFTPALIASIQVSEVIKLLIHRGEILRNSILYIDLLNMDFDVITIK